MYFYVNTHVEKSDEEYFLKNFLVLLIVIISAMKYSPFTADIYLSIQNDNSKFAHVRNWWDQILQFKGFF